MRRSGGRASVSLHRQLLLICGDLQKRWKSPQMLRELVQLRLFLSSFCVSVAEGGRLRAGTCGPDRAPPTPPQLAQRSGSPPQRLRLKRENKKSLKAKMDSQPDSELWGCLGPGPSRSLGSVWGRSPGTEDGDKVAAAASSLQKEENRWLTWTLPS